MNWDEIERLQIAVAVERHADLRELAFDPLFEHDPLARRDVARQRVESMLSLRFEGLSQEESLRVIAGAWALLVSELVCDLGGASDRRRQEGRGEA